MLFNRFAKRAVTVAALGAAAAGLAVIPAHAVEGNFLVVSSINCKATEIIRLERDSDGLLHDHMLVDPTVNIGMCLFQIWNNNTSMPAYSSESGAESPSKPDGPGQSLKVRVFTWKNRFGWVNEADGPSN
jgi:hypothetical protein